MLEKLRYEDKHYVKKYFSATDYGKWDLELYFAMTGVQKTNPINWRAAIRMGAGIGVEDRVMEVFKTSGLVDEYYIQEYDGQVRMEREGLEIHGYIDAQTIENELGLEPNAPIEVKSINNKNIYDIRDYENGKPRENYVGQLAVYMDYMDSDRGYLFVASVDGLNVFVLPCEKKGKGVYQCGEVIVNIDKEYKRWSSISKAVEEENMPDVFGYRYKYPLEEIDWRSLSPSKITKARNGSAVIGDWQVLYSPWKDLIVKMQGTELGYTDEEIAIIKQKTKGYTTWSKK